MASEDDDKAEANGWSLVLPFVACRSQGGPYEDDAFVAGFQTGQVDRALAAIAAVGGDGLTAMVREDLGPQLDLIAMRYGFHHVETVAEFADEHGVAVPSGGWMTWTCSRREAS